MESEFYLQPPKRKRVSRVLNLSLSFSHLFSLIDLPLNIDYRKRVRLFSDLKIVINESPKGEKRPTQTFLERDKQVTITRSNAVS